MDESQNGYGVELLSVFFSNFQVAEIFTFMASLWLGQSAARSAKISTILEHAGFYSAAYMKKDKEISAVLLAYIFSLIMIPLLTSGFILWNALLSAIILYPASLLKIYDWRSSQFNQTVVIGTLFFIVGLTSVSIIRVSEMKRDSN
jgi:hypothetical protein